MTETETDFLSFSVDSHLLQELGERLVSKTTVAYAELIKNAYDADATSCDVRISKGIVTIFDNGHGMTLGEIKARWMRVATTEKTKELKSRKYRRPLTGAKGVGRFAARTLGARLKLSTTAYDKSHRAFTTVIITFDWPTIDAAATLNEKLIEYTREIHDSKKVTGTTLTIYRPRHKLSDEEKKTLRSEILGLTNAFTPLWPPDRSAAPVLGSKQDETLDPGFDVTLNFGSDEEPANLAEHVLKLFAWRATITREKKAYLVKIWNKSRDKPVLQKQVPVLCGGLDTLYMDVRFFPRRKGQFRSDKVNGKVAYSWIKGNHGVRVYDRGFRVFPYGDSNDDWLRIDRDRASSERNWRSVYSRQCIPMSLDEQRDTNTNPMLYLPANHQLIGAVFVASSQGRKRDDGLIPSMDREGFVGNRAFKELFEITRFVVEYIAQLDRLEVIRSEQAEHEAKLSQAQDEFKDVVKAITTSPSISPADKRRLTATYAKVASNVDELEQYRRKVSESLNTMTLLGVLAGFMTHEHESVIWNIDRAIGEIDKIKNKAPGLTAALRRLKSSSDAIGKYVQYTRSFIRNINTDVRDDLQALPRIRRVVRAFDAFAEARSIDISIQVNNRILMPVIPIMMYEGIVMNLVSNALKAIIANKAPQQSVVLIKAWSDERKHYLSVSDTGTGIDEKLRERIWDPLFTTTSNLDSPLGTGMGLGLAIVKRVVESVGGTVTVAPPEPNYATRLEVLIPRKTRYGEN